jgi:hypothetical protein
MAAVEEALAAGESADGPMHELAKALNHHLEHEEEAGLPLIETVYTQGDWNAYTAAVRDQDGDQRQNPVTFLPWLMKDSPGELRARVIAVLPPPVRAMIPPA